MYRWSPTKVWCDKNNSQLLRTKPTRFYILPRRKKIYFYMEDFTIIRRHLMKNIHSDISFKKAPNRNLKKWVIVFIYEETKLTFFSFVYMTSPLCLTLNYPILQTFLSLFVLQLMTRHTLDSLCNGFCFLF